MDGLALSVFADALTLTLAALSADSPARCFTWHGGLRLPSGQPGLRVGVGSRLLDRVGSSCSVTNLCPALCDLVDCSLPGSSVFHSLPSSLQFMSVESGSVSPLVIVLSLL